MRMCGLTAAVLVVGLLAFAPARAGENAMAVVNAQRVARGLRPFVEDPALTAGAINVVDFRAARRLAVHTSNDMAGLPLGARADAAGCAAWRQGEGFGSCCCYEDWQYAGAAWVTGPDNRVYCQLFVRGGGGVSANEGPYSQQTWSGRRGFFRRR